MSEEPKKDKIEDRIASLFSKLQFTDIVDATIYAGLSYLGEDKLPKAIPLAVRLMWGPVALKLATTPASLTEVGINFLGSGIDVPVGPSIAGLTMLAILGFNCLPWGNLGAQFNEAQSSTENTWKYVLEIHSLAENVLSESDLMTLGRLEMASKDAIYRFTMGLPTISGLVGNSGKTELLNANLVLKNYVDYLFEKYTFVDDLGNRFLKDEYLPDNPDSSSSGGGARK